MLDWNLTKLALFVRFVRLTRLIEHDTRLPRGSGPESESCQGVTSISSHPERFSLTAQQSFPQVCHVEPNTLQSKRNSGHPPPLARLLTLALVPFSQESPTCSILLLFPLMFIIYEYEIDIYEKQGGGFVGFRLLWLFGRVLVKSVFLTTQ